jgi:single-strand DNA-binding protein
MSELKLPEINRVLLSGRLTRDPDRRYGSDGTEVTRFGLAFHRRYRGRDGTPAEQTGYVTVITYQRLAEVCAQYLKKGSAVLVEGRLQMREWTSPQGEQGSRLELRGEMVHFLERRPEGAPPAVGPPAGRASRPAPHGGIEGDELF